jgi:hypothetical protein
MKTTTNRFDIKLIKIRAMRVMNKTPNQQMRQRLDAIRVIE